MDRKSGFLKCRRLYRMMDLATVLFPQGKLCNYQAKREGFILGCFCLWEHALGAVGVPHPCPCEPTVAGAHTSCSCRTCPHWTNPRHSHVWELRRTFYPAFQALCWFAPDVSQASLPAPSCGSHPAAKCELCYLPTCSRTAARCRHLHGELQLTTHN